MTHHLKAGLGVLLMTLGLAVPAGAQARQGLLSLPDGTIFYHTLGAGDPIIIVHGGPGLDHNYLRPGLDVLASGNTLVYYDQRGTGRSEASLDSLGINIDAFVDDIDQLRQALGYEVVTVLAHSFGGLIGMRYALTHPERTRALILMNTNEPGSQWQAQAQARARAARTTADSVELAQLRRSEGFAERAAPVLSQIYRVAFRSTMRNPARVDDLNLDLSGRTARNGQDVAQLLGNSLGIVDWWGELAALDVPTLVIHGRHDPTPTAMARALADTLPQAEVAVLNTGHFPYVENPTALLEAVSAFLTGLSR